MLPPTEIVQTHFSKPPKEETLKYYLDILTAFLLDLGVKRWGNWRMLMLMNKDLKDRVIIDVMGDYF